MAARTGTRGTGGPESQFLAVIDMLRNEGPVSVYYASGSGFLHTGSEPIGEGEG
jgi:hypothetical protein